MTDTQHTTITLDTPIKRGADLLEKIVVRKPDANDMRGLSLLGVVRMDTDVLINLLPRISDPQLNMGEVLRMSPADLVQVGAFLAETLIPKSLQAAAAASVTN